MSENFFIKTNPSEQNGDRITDLKNAEPSPGKSEFHYMKLIDGLDSPIYVTDADGYITLFNKAAAALWGRSPEIGKDRWCGSFKMFTPDGRELAPDNSPMAKSLREGRPIAGEEIIILRPNGEKIEAVAHPQPLFDSNGNITGTVNMLLEVTGMRASEELLRESERTLRQLSFSLEDKMVERTNNLLNKNEELKKSEERYHKMIEEVVDYAIVLLDQNGIIQNWNKGAEKIKGYTEQEIVGKSFTIFYLDEDRQKDLPGKLVAEARARGRATHEGWRLRKDGTRFWGSIVITALHDIDSNIIGFSKVTRDLTERKSAEDKMIRYTSQLEFQNRELQQFAFAASHDMKEPLRKISFYTDYIAQHNVNSLDAKSGEYLQRSLSAVKRMSKLIDDLLTYSTSGSGHDNFEKVNFNTIVADIVSSHEDLIDQGKVIFETGELPTLPGIPFQLKQMMDNLINNAIKYSHPSRVCIIRIKSERIVGSTINHIEADNTRWYHQITVSDNGLGFDNKFADKIFEIFQRLANQSDYRGSGIGLAICRRVIQNHRGFIVASGKENVGARFDIYLPGI